MNFDKNPKQARRMAKKQKALRKKVSHVDLDLLDNVHISSKDLAQAGWELTFENYDEVGEAQHLEQFHEQRRRK